MNGMEAVCWITSVCFGLRKSQIKTLADLVAVAILVGRVSLSELGRLLAEEREGAAKHGIKRAWRFTANQRVHISDAMQGPLRWLFRNRRTWQDHPLLVTFDWTEVRSFHTLMAAAVIRGRGVPLLWASYEEWVLYKSQNNLEEGLLRLLKSLLPDWITIILVADRGFGRTELARTCQQMGVHYVIRIKPDVYIECRKFRGKLDLFSGQTRHAATIEGRSVPPGETGRAKRSGLLEKGIAKGTRRVLVPHDRPHLSGDAVDGTLRSADDDRGTVPRREESPPRLGVAQHTDYPPRSIRSLAADPDAGVLAVDWHWAPGVTPLSAWHLVQQQSAWSMRGILHRSENGPPTATHSRPSTFRITPCDPGRGRKLGISQRWHTCVTSVLGDLKS